MRARRGLALHVFALASVACGSCSPSHTLTVRDADGHVASVGEHVHGLRNGPWTDYYPDGKKQSEGRYANDLQAGEWTFWFENGNKEMEGRFANERRDGGWRSWYENGALRAEGNFEAGFEEGPWRFYESSGALDHAGSFECGLPVLRWTYLDADGNVRETGNYHAGVKVGTWTARDAAGAATETNYPLPAGWELVEERFADTTLKRAGFLHDGVPAGRWQSFHPGGKLRLECTFQGGAPSGVARAWREDGSLLARGSLANGSVTGTWVFRRGGVDEPCESGAARPRATYGGEWSPADSADAPGWTAVETWVAEMCSPRQPAPLSSAAAVTKASTAPAPSLAFEDATGVPARAQPWTEYERGAMSGLVQLYSTGTAERTAADEWKQDAMQHSPSRRVTPVSTPAELVGRTLPLKRFATADGGELDLDAFRDGHNVLVTILRGFGGHVCVYCATQTKALADRAAEFEALNTRIVVVYPGPASGLSAFLEAYRRTFVGGGKIPFPLLYDADLGLTRALHLEDNLAVPTSLVLDRNGVIRWCHVARDQADRPSASEILERIAELAK